MTYHSHLSAWRTAHATLHAAVIPMLLLAVPRLHAQTIAPSWRVYGEVGGAFGGTWLRGVAAPTVTTDPGATIGLSAQRELHAGISVGAGARVGAQSVVMKEAGATWSGGTLTETDGYALASFRAPQGTFARPSFQVGGGIAFLSGARAVVPFRDAQRYAPLMQAEVAVRRDNADPTRREIALLVRANVLRLSAGGDGASATSSSGWVRRFALGVQIAR